ncbi:MAG: tetratricopeptide repeat protein [Gemmatimonadetes bacterium]|nr:tetratricopeptide repeat protein [Gemmatimonadota bacterium]MYB62089.1 tetratricopeptide repeat protein [Gemmatimonadota bacterium]
MSSNQIDPPADLMSALSPLPLLCRTLAGFLLSCCLMSPIADATASNAQPEPGSAGPAGPPGQARPTSTLDALLEEGLSLYDQRKFEEAKTVFEEAVRLKSKSGEARYWLGVSHYELGEDRDAAKQLRIAVRNDRKNPDAHLALGRTYMRMKNRMVDARKSLKQALRYDPEHSEVHYYLGVSYMAQSKRDPAAPLYVMQARRSFGRAAAANPLHPDAYYRLGLSYENPSRDYKKALALFYRQLMVKPDHRDALDHLERCSYMLKQFREGIDLLTQVVEVHGDAVPDYVHTLINKLRATSLQSQSRYAEADRAYGEFLVDAAPEERAHYMDLAHVTSEEEFRQYQALETEAAKAEFRRRFWAARDPKPATAVNERLVEHYRRVMHAREHFSSGQQPWDRRGGIYIRYGEPDDLQHFIMQTGENAMKNYQPTGDARIDAIRERNFILRYRLKIDNSGETWSDPTTRGTRDPDAGDYLHELEAQQDDYSNIVSSAVTGGKEVANTATFSAISTRAQSLGFLAESWVYLEHDLELFFVDQVGVGKFDYPLQVHETNITEAFVQDKYNPRRIAASLMEKTPESYEFDYGGGPLRFMYDIVSYKGRDGLAEVETAYMVPAEQLETVEDGQGLRTWLDSHMVFHDDDYNRVAQTSRRVGPIDRPLVPVSGNAPGIELHTGMMEMEAPPGSFRAAIEVQDETTRRIGIYEQGYAVPDYDGDALVLSDIKLAVSITPADSIHGPFVRNGLEIVPNPARLYQRTDPVHFYYEIYNLALSESGRTAYRVELEMKNKDRPQNLFWRILKGIDRLVRRTDNEQSVLMVFENEGNRPDEFSYTSIDTGATPTGAYEMTVRVTDLHSGQTATRQKVFVVTNDRVAEFKADTE